MNRVVAGTINIQRLSLVPLVVEHATEMRVVLADPDLYAFTGGAPPEGYEDVAGVIPLRPVDVDDDPWARAQAELDDFVAYCDAR